MLFPIDHHLKYVATTTTINPLRRVWPQPKRDPSVPQIERPGLIICLAGPFLQRLHSDQAKCRVRPGSRPGSVFVACVLVTMTLEFSRRALNLIRLDAHPETFPLAIAVGIVLPRSCSGASLLLLFYFQVILKSRPALASLQMMLWTLTTALLGPSWVQG